MLWRVLDTGRAGAAANMAIDEAILLAHSRGDVPPTLRFYCWNPSAVSLGYFQQAQESIDLEECSKQGIDVVRRLTGGRAVLHDAELTYSIVIREDVPCIPSTITASYRYFSNVLLAGLDKLGVSAQMSMPRSAYAKTNRKEQLSSAACFDSPSGYEIIYEGRKLVGSAQVRKHGVILQHGSILLDFSPEKLAAVLKFSSSLKRSKMVRVLANHVISIREILGRKVTGEEMRAAMLAAFCSTIGANHQRENLTADERLVSQQLVEKKYGSLAWSYKR